MTNPYIERAADVIRKFRQAVSREMALQCGRDLNDSGLLLTPLHERALEACEKYVSKWGSPGAIPENIAVYEVGRESLALKEKAKGARWDVESFSTEGRFIVVNAEDRNQRHGFFTESQARRVAAALNEGDK